MEMPDEYKLPREKIRAKTIDALPEPMINAG